MYPRFLEFGAFVISTYGVLALVAVACGLTLWTSIARRRALPLPAIQNAGFLAVLAIVLGSRLAVILENWRGFLTAPLLVLTAGTMRAGSAAAWGVAIACVACAVSLRRARVPLLQAASTSAPAIALAAGILDIGDFAAGTHYGTQTLLPWGAIYTSRFAARTAGVPLGIALHPVQIYMAMAHFTLAALLLIGMQRGMRDLEVLGTAFIAEGVLRYLMAPLSGDYLDAPVVLHAITMGQAMGMLLVAVGAIGWLDIRPRGEHQHA